MRNKINTETGEIIRHHVTLDFDLKNPKSVSLTKQSHKNECDINQILAKYQKSKTIQHLNKHEPQYAEISSLSFREAQETIATAKTMFEELPSSVRNKFENNPEKFLDFVQDSNNHQEAYELGLSENPPEPELVQPLVEPVVVPPAEAPAEPTPTA